jgi:hypothetical protein
VPRASTRPLLFLLEPIAAKQLLPTLGSSAVWLTCLVFFQVTLLLGYLYAHWLTSCRFGLETACLYRHTQRSSPSAVAQRIFPATLSPSSRSSGHYHLRDPCEHHRAWGGLVDS